MWFYLESSAFNNQIFKSLNNANSHTIQVYFNDPSSVVLDNCVVSDTAFIDILRPICEALKNNSTVSAFCIIEYEFLAEHSVLLGELLQSNYFLKELYFFRVHLSKNVDFLIGTHLTELTLKKASLFADGIKALCNALKDNATIISLDVESNQIRDTGIFPLAAWVIQHPTLKSLNVSSNLLCSEGVAILMNTLNMRRHLTRLDISCNAIDHDSNDKVPYNFDGIKAIENYLIYNSTLLSLSASDDLHTYGLYTLSYALRRNNTLQHLNILGWDTSGAIHHLYLSLENICSLNTLLYTPPINPRWEVGAIQKLLQLHSIENVRDYLTIAPEHMQHLCINRYMGNPKIFIELALREMLQYFDSREVSVNDVMRRIYNRGFSILLKSTTLMHLKNETIKPVVMKLKKYYKL